MTRALATQRLLWLAYLGFISLGLPDTLLGASWPALRAQLGLPLDAAGTLLLVTTIGVVLSSATSGALRSRWGTGRVLVVSTLLAASALAATGLAQHPTQLLVAALIAGLGGGAIDASLNDHVARHHPARQLTWLHACWGIGATTGPMLVASILSRGSSWRLAYAIVAAVEALLSLSFLRTAALWREQVGSSASVAAQASPPARRTMLASVLLFYVYGGLEAGTGLWTSSLLIGTRGVSPAQAGAAVALFWGALTVGRVVIGLYADALGPMRVLRASSYFAVLACLALALPHGSPVLVALALSGLGLSLAPIYPLAMHDTPTRFGDTWGARLVGYQVAAGSLGVATLPWLLGVAAEATSLALLPRLFLLLALVLLLLQRARLGSHPKS